MTKSVKKRKNKNELKIKFKKFIKFNLLIKFCCTGTFFDA